VRHRRTGRKAWQCRWWTHRSTSVGRASALTALMVIVVVPLAIPVSSGATGSPGLAQLGYRVVGGDGGIFTYGAPFLGSAAADPTTCPPDTTDRSMPFGTCLSMATTPTDQGYWVLNAYTGAITPFGDAVSFGDRTASNTGGADLWPTSVAITPTWDGRGYWLLNVGLSGLGTVQAFGDAVAYGDQSTIGLTGGPDGRPVGMVATGDGKGYWIVDSDGGVFAFGDAVFCGSMGGRPLNAPVVGMARVPGAAGYWLVAADGGVFSFGAAAYGGSMAGTHLASPVVGMAAEPFGAGYWLASGDGGVFALGGAPFLGSAAGEALHQPIFGINAAAPAPI